MIVYKKAKIKSDRTKQIKEQIANYKYITFVEGSVVKDPKSKSYRNVRYGGILLDNTDPDTCKELVFSFYENVGGELKAALISVEIAISKKWNNLLICHDCLGISEYTNHKWFSTDRAIIKHINKIKEFRSKIKIDFLKIPAHTGISLNERADELAKEAVNINKQNKNNITINKTVLTREDAEFFKKTYKTIFLK